MYGSALKEAGEFGRQVHKPGDQGVKHHGYITEQQGRYHRQHHDGCGGPPQTGSLTCRDASAQQPEPQPLQAAAAELDARQHLHILADLMKGHAEQQGVKHLRPVVRARYKSCSQGQHAGQP